MGVDLDQATQETAFDTSGRGLRDGVDFATPEHFPRPAPTVVGSWG